MNIESNFLRKYIIKRYNDERKIGHRLKMPTKVTTRNLAFSDQSFSNDLKIIANK